MTIECCGNCRHSVETSIDKEEDGMCYCRVWGEEVEEVATPCSFHAGSSFID